MATRPCASSASRYNMISPGSLPSVAPSGSKKPIGLVMPGRVFAKAGPLRAAAESGEPAAPEEPHGLAQPPLPPLLHAFCR